MRIDRLLALLIAVALPACVPRGPVYPGSIGRANATETLEITLAPAQVTQAIAAIQSDRSFDDQSVGIDIMPLPSRRRTSDVETSIYVAALADARAKAQAIAAKLGLTLGPVRGVAELAPEASAMGYANAAMPAPVMHGAVAVMRSGVVTTQANGVVTLAVTFDAGTVPISVFGVHAGALPAMDLANASGVSMNIRTHGSDLRAAEERLHTVESSVRAIVRRFGATGANIVISGASSNTY